MLVDKIEYGAATFTFSAGDLNTLAYACTVAGENIVDEEDAATAALIEALGAAFVGSWHACQAQLDTPAKKLVQEVNGQ